MPRSYCAAFLVLLTLVVAGCGNSSTTRPMPISASSPLYVASFHNGAAQLNVIDMRSYSVAGTIPLYSLGDNNVLSIVGLSQPLEDGIIESNPETTLNNKVVINSAIRSCLLSTGACVPLSSNEGSPLILFKNNTVFVPFSGLNGENLLAIFPNASLKGAKTIDLPSGYSAGPITVAPDGGSIFWIARKLQTSSDPNVLLHYNLLTGSIDGQYDLGNKTISSIKVLPIVWTTTRRK